MPPTSRPGGLEWVLSRDPLTAAEQQVFDADLHAHGLDGAYWWAMHGLLATGSQSDTPLALRAFRRGRLSGVAHLVECRRTSRCLFPGALGTMMDLAPMPSYCWTRGDPGVDMMASPGFVAEGEDRQVFYRDAIAFLNRRYAMGSVMEPLGATPAGPCYETVMMDWGQYTVVPGRCEALVQAHGNLRRKMSKFRNKGGDIEVVSGRLGERTREAVMRCVDRSATAGLLRTPFQQNYANMVRWAAETAEPGMVHVLARLEGDVVGYHTYLRTGTRLQCCSGGFDRTRRTTYHAYEYILLETMRYAEAGGLTHVAFGPVTNPSKAAVLPEFAPYVLRFYSRFTAVRRLLAIAVPRSAIRPAVVAPYVGLRGLAAVAPPVRSGGVPQDARHDARGAVRSLS
jgi:hypothetical protein